MSDVDTEKVVLVLQGGGALGAYQGGAYQALAEAGYEPDWVTGISIGAINGALIAGNPPGRRVRRLREFWEMASAQLQAPVPLIDTTARIAFNETSAILGALFGINGFYAPRVPPPFLQWPGTFEAISYYDTAPLYETLRNLVDFDYLAGEGPRLSVGAVAIESGNFAYFDTVERRLGPEHVVASGALPPGFPPVEIDGVAYWDGGLVSNTPLDYVMEYTGPPADMCIFQVDVFDARGHVPREITEVSERVMDIRYSSRTRLTSDYVRKLQEIRAAAHRLTRNLPDDLADGDDARLLRAWSRAAAITVAQLIRRDNNWHRRSKDHEFSRRSVEEHWRTGYENVARGLKRPDWVARHRPRDGIAVFDLTRDETRR
jgi:NTE family protein